MIDRSRCPTTALFLILGFALSSGTYPANADSGSAAEEENEATPQGDGEVSGDAPVYSETLVVTASRIELSIADAPAAVSVVGPERLESAAFDNYADVLRGLPGMNVIQMSARDFSFTTRAATGAAANSQLVLLDGRSVYHDYTGFVLWDYLSVNFREMSQIEIQRGPGSAIWGAHALNGVINLRTKSPRQLEGGEVMLSGGEVGAYGVFARWGKAHDKWSYKLTANYYQQDAWARDDTLPSGEPLPPGADYRNEGTKQPSFDVRFDYEPAGDQRWSFQSGAASSSGILHTPIGPATIHAGDYMGYGKVAYTRGSLDASLFVNRFHWDATNFFFSLPHTISNHTLAADVTDRQALGSRQVLVYGGSLRSNHFDVTLAPAGDGRNEASLFLEDQIHLNGKLQLNLGARVDWFETIGATFSPRASLILQPHPDHSLRFAFARAYRPPTLIENHLDAELANAIVLDPAAPVFVFTNRALGNDQLDEELVDSFEISYMVNLARRATLEITGYHSRKKDLIDLYTTGFYGPDDPPAGWPLPPAFVPPFTLPKSFGFRNIGKVVNRGIELASNIQLDDMFTATASYTWQDRPEVTGGDLDLSVNVPPAHQISAAVRADAERWFGSFGAAFVDDAFWTDVLDPRFWGPTQSYTLLDGRLGYRFASGRYSVAVRGTNLTDEKAKQHVFGDIIGRKLTVEVRMLSR